jgi:hypothetical protein
VSPCRRAHGGSHVPARRRCGMVPLAVDSGGGLGRSGCRRRRRTACGWLHSRGTSRTADHRIAISPALRWPAMRARSTMCLRQLGSEREAERGRQPKNRKSRKGQNRIKSEKTTTTPIRPHSFAPRAAVKAARLVHEFPPRRTGHGRAGAARGVQPLAGLRVFDVRPERRGAAAGDAAAETTAAEGEPPTGATHSTARGARRAR